MQLALQDQTTTWVSFINEFLDFCEKSRWSLVLLVRWVHLHLTVEQEYYEHTQIYVYIYHLWFSPYERETCIHFIYAEGIKNIQFCIIMNKHKKWIWILATPNFVIVRIHRHWCDSSLNITLLRRTSLSPIWSIISAQKKNLTNASTCISNLLYYGKCWYSTCQTVMCGAHNSIRNHGAT